MLDFAALKACLEGEGPDTGAELSIWTDPYVSARLLEAHLDPGTDAASRRPESIDATVAWIARVAGPGPMDVLDLGCGPGLYAERLAREGRRVRGLDFSPSSIDHARRSATRAGLPIEYRQADYLAAELGGPYDLALLIYCDLGALDRGRRRILLSKIRSALRPGGAFAFDILDERFLASAGLGRDWSAREAGFWSPRPHLVWEETRHLPEQRAVLRRYVIAEPDTGRVRRYDIRDTYFSDADIRAELLEAGLELELSDRGVLPPCDFKGIEPVFHLARAV